MFVSLKQRWFRKPEIESSGKHIEAKSMKACGLLLY
jgi:hypothetical protein